MLTPINWLQMLLNQTPYLVATIASLVMLALVGWAINRWMFPKTELRNLIKNHALGPTIFISSLIGGICYIIGQGLGG